MPPAFLDSIPEYSAIIPGRPMSETLFKRDNIRSSHAFTI